MMSRPNSFSRHVHNSILPMLSVEHSFSNIKIDSGMNKLIIRCSVHISKNICSKLCLVYININIFIFDMKIWWLRAKTSFLRCVLMLLYIQARREILLCKLNLLIMYRSQLFFHDKHFLSYVLYLNKIKLPFLH